MARKGEHNHCKNQVHVQIGNLHRIEFSLKLSLLGVLPGEVHWSGIGSGPEKSCLGDMKGCFNQGR